MKKKSQDQNPKKQKNQNKQERTTLNDLFTYKNDKETFMESFSMLLESGVEIISALESIKLEMKSQKMRTALEKMQNNLSNGTSLSYALNESNIVNNNSLALIKIGEKSGKLNENLQIVINKEKKEKDFKSKVKSAMLYPIIVLSVTILVGIVTMWLILPKLSKVFKQLKLELPLTTRLLLKFGEFIEDYGVIFFPLSIIVLVIILYIFFFNSKTKHLGYDFLLHVPIIKDLLKNVELSRFGYFLGSLTDAGIPIPEAITSLEISTESRVFKHFYSELRTGILNGLSFKNIFENNSKSEKLIPKPIQQMVVAGENSGKLSRTLVTVGEKYESKIDYYAKNMSSILEPVLLVFVWIGVVFVAASVILPIYSLVGNLNDPIDTTTQNTPPPVKEENIENTNFSENDELADVIKENDPDENENQNIEKANETLVVVENENLTENSENNEENILDTQKIEILNTNVGYLNVRENATLQSNVIDRVSPGDIFVIQDETDDWYKIEYDEFLYGWVFKTYTKLTIE